MQGMFNRSGRASSGSIRGTLDPLLTAARVLLYVLLAGIVLAALFTGFGLIVYLAGHIGELFLTTSATLWRPVGSSVFSLGALVLVGSSVLALLGIIAAVEQGDPFVSDNAARLEKIAGNVLGLQVLGFIAALAGLSIGGDINGFDLGYKLSPGGIAVVLLLFILARVFRKGAAMREDLEGTV